MFKLLLVDEYFSFLLLQVLLVLVATSVNRIFLTNVQALVRLAPTQVQIYAPAVADEVSVP